MGKRGSADPDLKALVDSYLVETLRRAQSTARLSSSLFDQDYASDAPQLLAKTIEEVCVALQQVAIRAARAIPWQYVSSVTDLETHISFLQIADSLVQDLATQVRYVESAQTIRLPCSIIRAVEKLAEGLLGNRVRIMLRPQWHYNYATLIEDLGGGYRSRLTDLPTHLLSKKTIRGCLARLSRPFHLISFPAIERTNVLLHPLIGHEVGHLLTSDSPTASQEAEYWRRVRPRVNQITAEELALEVPRRARIARQKTEERLRNRNAKLVIHCWRRALEELLSDAVEAMVFGPAALFASLLMAMQEGFDVAPGGDNDFYPPWRYRLRLILRLVSDSTRPRFFPFSPDVFRGSDAAQRARRVNEYYRRIEAIVAEKSDLEVIAAVPLLKVAYDNIDKYYGIGIEDLRAKKGVKQRTMSPQRLFTFLPSLLERLDARVPPNAIEESICDSRVAGFVDIVNAAWFYRIAAGERVDAAKRDVEAVLEARSRLDHLTLKAVEYGDLASEYWSVNGPPEDDDSAGNAKR
jgi:hypothetical protein